MGKRTFDQWKRSVLHRFRSSFKRSLAVEREKYEKALDELKEKHKVELQRVRDSYRLEINGQDEQATRLAREISRIRLEFGPEQYGMRFQMYVTMDERFMLNVQNLKDMGPYIIDKLTLLIKREFAQIDFTRMKPVVPRSYDEARRFPPRWYADTKEM